MKGTTVPLIQVDLAREVYDSSHEAIGNALHDAQIDALGIPADDRFQIFTPHDAGDYGVERVASGAYDFHCFRAGWPAVRTRDNYGLLRLPALFGRSRISDRS